MDDETLWVTMIYEGLRRDLAATRIEMTFIDHAAAAEIYHALVERSERMHTVFLMDNVVVLVRELM